MPRHQAENSSALAGRLHKQPRSPERGVCSRCFVSYKKLRRPSLRQILHLYSSSRIIVLLAGELSIILASFVLAIFISFRADAPLMLWASLWKLAVVAVLMVLCAYAMELYDHHSLAESYGKLAVILKSIGVVAFILAGIAFLYPSFLIGKSTFLLGLLVLTPLWLFWRTAGERLVLHPALRERIYILGDGELANRVFKMIDSRNDLAMDVVGWERNVEEPELVQQSLRKIVVDIPTGRTVDRVIVALHDRRSAMPVKELLDLRLNGVVVEEATTLVESLSGKIEIDELRPSWLIFGDGFRLQPKHLFTRRVVSTLASLVLTVLTIPIVPIIALLIRITSPGPVLYRQKRVGLRGKTFNCYKFRTMRCDAEADTGPTWAQDNDPRITAFGRLLRASRLDEIPQLWNVLKGDMAFVGPRPERPEFVNQLNQVIPYYGVRHATLPGITGWAQVSYKYGNTLEDAKEKLRYDLYYIKNWSPALDFWIMFKTIRTVLFGKGAQ